MNRFFKSLFITIVYLFLYLPVAIFIIYSFNNAKFSSMWNGATLHWYRVLFSDIPLLIVTGHSLVIAVLAASMATFVGALGACALFRYRFFGKKLLDGLIFVLIIVPDLVFGISLLVLYVTLKIQLGFWTLLLAHITFCLPFVVVTVYGRLDGTDKNILEAAKDLGASDYLIFKRIILPLMIPALIAGWLLSFTLSMDDVIVSFFVSGPTYQILPLYIYSQIHVGITPEINALCTLIFVFTVTLVLASRFLLKGTSKN
jgi:spermidine/putrescine transport system permease protein